MKYITGLIFLLSFFSTYANKPFSTWQLDNHQLINFYEQECLYDFTSDTNQKSYAYRHTDILTDKIGNPIYSFDCYPQKVIVRDARNLIVGEVDFPQIGIKFNYISSIILPFYNQDKCFFTFLVSDNAASKAQLYYFELDYNNSLAKLSQMKQIPTEGLLQNVMSATINKKGNGYFIAVANYNKVEVIIVNLESNGSASNKSYQLGKDSSSEISFSRQVCFSPQGDKLIANINTNQFNFFTFDNSTGEADFKFYIEMLKEFGMNIRGALVFSQNGEKLYSQSGHEYYIIHQFDLSKYNKSDVLNSKYDIISLKANCVDCLFRNFQLAPNNKIYITYNSSYLTQYVGRKDSTYLGVINCPNAAGPYIDFELLGVTVPVYIDSTPFEQNIPSNFLATPQAPTFFEPFDDVIQYCISTNDTLKGIDDACGEQMWIKNDGTKVYSKDLIFENIKAEDAGLYFYHFQNCYQVFNDTFAIKIIDKIDPQIVKVSPDKLDLCQNPFEEITFTSKEKYKVYKWYFTKSGTSNRVQIGDQDTIRISELGLLEMEVIDEGGCEGLASYSIEKAQIEFPQIEEYEIRICRGIEQSYSIDFPLKSNKSLTVDSLALRLGDKMSISNKSFLIDTYPNGEFKRNIIIDFDRLSEGIIYDTLDIFVDSECKRKISLPLKIIIENTKFVLEAPHLRTTIGEKDFEIPIYLTTTCLEPTDDFNFEATIVLSKDKFYLNRVDGVNLINTFTVNKMQNIRISYDGSSLSNNGRIQIGSLFGTVLLSDNDSTGIFFTDTASNYVFDLLDGSLVTENICFQNLRQVFFFDNSLDVSIAGNLITIKSNDSYRGNINIKILNYIGQNINEFNINKNEDKIDKNIQLVGNSTGLYFLLISEGNYSEIKKIFIE